jgi:hypothetical protein
MLLVKSLISYDVNDKLPVSHFQLSALPETYPDTSCLDILNFFQEGKSKVEAFYYVSLKPKVNIYNLKRRSYGHCIK